MYLLSTVLATKCSINISLSLRSTQKTQSQELDVKQPRLPQVFISIKNTPQIVSWC